MTTFFQLIMGIFHTKYLLLPLCLLISYHVSAQVSFEVKTSPDVSFSFVSVGDYIGGKTRMGALRLKVDSDRRWDMWVKATTPGWNVVDAYGSAGAVPDLDLLQLSVRNASGTSNITGFFPISNSEQYLIGSALTDIDVACPGGGANVAGDYLSNRACYEFTVDFRVVPGIDPVSYIRPGYYRLDILFTIVEDL